VKVIELELIRTGGTTRSETRSSDTCLWIRDSRCTHNMLSISTPPSPSVQQDPVHIDECGPLHTQTHLLGKRKEISR